MDAPVAGETLAFEGWRFDMRAGDLARQDPDRGWVRVSIGTRARHILAILLQRPGALVSKDTIIDAVWPNVTVEPNNLTVQIATLRRILDEGRAGGSCIETVPGRGYRFVPRVTHLVEAQPDPLPVAEPAPLSPCVRWPPHRLWPWWLVAGSCAIGVAALLALGVWCGGWFAGQPPPPRLSLAVLAFQNLGDVTGDHLADGITDDLTTELALVPGALVAARESADTFRGKAADVRRIGEALNVRYVLEGSVRRIDETLRVNVQLISTETGVHLWSDRFDERVTGIGDGQEQIVMRVRDELGPRLVEVEAARSLRERPSNPDALDLVLRARAIRNLPPAPQRDEQVKELLERALALDTGSVYAMAYIVYYLAGDAIDLGWGTFGKLQRAKRLITEARALAPNSEMVLNTYVEWQRAIGRCPEAIETAERAIQTDPKRTRVWTGLYNELARCKMMVGDAEEALSLHEQADRLNPRSTYKFQRYSQMGLALLLLGRDHEAVGYLERSLAMHPFDSGGWRYRRLAAAYALTGQELQARHALAEADRLSPYGTVRGNMAEYPSSFYAKQMRHIQDGLRLAGERDHADEYADFGVPTDRDLHSEAAGHTPMSAPGATTIHTPELERLLSEARPIVIDVVDRSYGASIPGAVRLKFSGLGGNYTDEAQDRLRSKMRELTAGDLHKPIVVAGWNSEHFGGRNLALRLVALDYKNVYWYRGGREAWEVAGLPETQIDIQDW